MMRKLLPLLLLLASVVSVSAQTVTLSVPVTPCNNDGVITATITGLTPPLTVTWVTEGSTGTTITHSVTGMTDALTGYSGGPLNIMVTDGTGFASNFFAGAHPISYTLNTVGAICPGLGSIAATGVTGGTAPYSYQWFDKNTGSVVSAANPASLAAGRYGVIITDAAGCRYGSRHQTDSVEITYTSFTATLTATPAGCTDGTATVAAISASAVPPISYLWSTGAATSGISGLTSGTYEVEITDALGCKATTDTAAAYNPYSVFVPQSTILSIPLTTTPTTCTSADGAIATFPTGGTAPYSYIWNNGATTASQTGLPSGAYYVTVTDANGCSGSASTFIGTATPISVSFSSSPSLCTSPTGNASLTAVGGTPPYSVMWYTTPLQTSTTATGLAAGNYTFLVTDALGCTRDGIVTVPPINTILTTFSSTSPLCALSNGSISVSATGGAAPYSYLWSNGATTSSISSVPASSYSVRVTDAMGCKVTPNFNLSSYSPVSIGLSVTDASCIFANDGSITATPYGGTAPYSYGWSTGGSTATISALGKGHYWMTATDASGCKASGNVHVGYDATETSCYCTIEGTVYNDTIVNCNQDAGEPGIPHVQIFCSGRGYTYTDAAGHYSFIVPAGTYTIREVLHPYYPLSACQANNISVTAASGAGCVNTVNFANASVPVHNLRISTTTTTPPVPGNTMIQQVTIVNEGTLTEDSTFSVYRPDGQLLTPAFTPSGIFTGSPYTYATAGFPSMAPGANQRFTIAYNVPTNIPLGTNVRFRDTVAYNSAAGAWLSDYSPANNVCDHNTNVVASYDPNFKEVYPRGTGTNGIITTNDTVLEYTVHFQNTGTWYAQNIEVLDTLDSDLDWTSLHPVYESAPCQVSLYQTGTVKVAKFSFSNINLPPQIFDDLRSNGMFTYSIKTLPGLPVGTQFKNSASIYFDYNAPILTNTTTNTIGSTAPPILVGTTATTRSSFAVYPNPASNNFSAVINSENAGTAVLNIADVSGKTLISKTLSLQQGTQTITTDINQLAGGIYFVSINNNGKLQTQKLVVIK